MTNARLDVRGGTELAVRQHARAVHRLGHSLIGFTSDPQRQPRFLESDVVPVATALADLPVVTDLIHAQHHLDAMTTISLLTDVPMVFQCVNTDWSCVPVHPRIHAYLVSSSVQADQLRQNVHTTAEVHVWRRPLDLERLHAVRTPPAEPRRGLYFNRRRPGDEALVSAIQKVSAGRGVTIDLASPTFNRSVDATQTLFAPYDVVFTAGEAAAEAIACGCAVVMTDRGVFGEMVVPENVTRLAAEDFRIGSSPSEVSDEDVEAQLGRYSADGSAAVARRLRSEVDSADAFATLIHIYEGVIERHHSATWDSTADLKAVARYLGRIAPDITALNYELQGQWARPDRDHTFYDLRARLQMVEERLRSR